MLEVTLVMQKVVLVTGASRGIGREIALQKAKSGFTVILLSRNIKKLESLYDEIVKHNYPEPAIYPFNLATANYDDYLDLKRTIDQNFSKLDELVLNAGVLGTLTPLEYFEIDKWYQTMQVNQNSKLMLIQACILLLKRAPKASITFNIPKVAVNPKPNWGAYAVASAGTRTMAQILKQELDNTNIDVKIITPPATETTLRRQVYPAEDKTTLNTTQKTAELFCVD